MNYLAIGVIGLSAVIMLMSVSMISLVRTMRRQRRAADAALACVEQWRVASADWETACHSWKSIAERNAASAAGALEECGKYREMFAKYTSLDPIAIGGTTVVTGTLQ